MLQDFRKYRNAHSKYQNFFKQKQTILYLLQPMFQLSPAQKRHLLALRQTYLMQLAMISKSRQQLLLQLQQVPGPQGVSHQELFSARVASDTIIQQLQDCSALEHKLYIQNFIAAAHGVSS